MEKGAVVPSRISHRDAAALQFKEVGTPIAVTEGFLRYMAPDEGELNLIYGKIGQGKTYAATADVLRSLRRGKVVYTTWKINYDGFDERKDLLSLVAGLLFPWRRIYARFPKENLHFLDVYADDIWKTLHNLNDCIIYFDDCIVHLFDSYEKTFFDKKKRQWAFETRHFDRSIVLVTQRPTQVQVALRSQVNRFYKCEKKKLLWLIPFFQKSEYQDMINESVDDSKEPDSVERYYPKQHIFEAYQSKYLRKGAASSQKLYIDLFRLSYSHRLSALSSIIFSRLKPRKNYRGDFLDVHMPVGAELATSGFESVQDVQLLGVKETIATKKKSGRLNTATLGGNTLLDAIEAEREAAPF